jgi:hypothetical protein
VALELQYYGQNFSLFGPDLALTGDPAIDNAALEAAGFNAGVLVKVGVSTLNPDEMALQIATDADAVAGTILGAIITIPGEFANTIGPSGSNRISVARAHFVGNVLGAKSFDQALLGAGAIAVGDPLYCGLTGLYTAAGTAPVAICSHVPTAIEPWLGVISLI